MKSIEQYVAEYKEVVQREVPNEQVVAVGMLSRPGSMSTGLLAQVSGAAALINNKSGKSKSGDLPMNVVVAVTPTRVLFYGFKPKMTSIKLKGLVLELPRAGMRVAVEENTLTSRVMFQLSDGSGFQLDSNRSIGQYNKMNDWLLAELAR